jgi:Tol biopolymer transport system component
VSRSQFDANAAPAVDQVYLWDRGDGTSGSVVTRVTAGSQDVDRGGFAPSISGDGRYVAFVSRMRFPVDPNAAPDVDQVYLWDRVDGPSGSVVARVSAGSQDVDRGASAPSISGDGRYVAFVSRTRFPVDPNAAPDVDQVYLWDRDDGPSGSVVARISTGSQDVDRGGFGASVSGDGRIAAFTSLTIFDADDVNTTEDVYVRCR